MRLVQRLPPLNGLRTFVAAARLGSFLKASEELHVTPAAVSRAIRALEDYLGCALFHRGHRQVQLTSEGKGYLRDIGDVFERIALATENLSAHRFSRPLTVCAYPSFMIDWLIPRWSKRQGPVTGFELRFVTTHTHDIDFEAGGVDVAILTDRAEFRHCVCEKLFNAGLVAVCAPNYLPAGVLAADYPDWQGSLLGSDTRPDDWARWARTNGLHGLDTSRQHRFESSMLMYQSAAAGLGIAIGIREVLSREFAARSLIMPFADERAAECLFCLIRPPATEAHPFFAAFRAWIRRECGLGEAAS